MPDPIDTEGTHPDLAAALAAMERGDDGWPAAIISISLQARHEQDKGRYCECREPIVNGTDLLCARCLLNNRDQEIRKLDESLSPHDFVESTRSEAARKIGMCDLCTRWRDDPRHNGGPAATGRTSWGEDYTPPREAPDA